ncbi:HNH endonuclease [Paenibacillus polymyxa]|nr:HNH endonuclease [Paenibacillus polymyxa]MBE7896963.1 HNH endonuclease [Paenibacillus polymyxa]MBG9767119.1 hypothetical protein [Paenibacillus polymyxa]MCC3258825.1 HNH endonuclease [Paenibacillus polymyxa]MDN4086191.1 HNH endonuclease [Paenibacillus polymyxa]MDN4088515.1 HNH endonuclease [Paenibacillus polymyxa]
MNSKTKLALMQRKIDSKLAEQLIARGFTLGKLKQQSSDELRGLGLMKESIDIIQNESRPPIPEDTVRKLLFESNYTCCLCKDSSKSIIIHHINPWESSRSHDINNLVVLCLQHHDEAHTKHELSINLTPGRIRDAKKRWLESVQEKGINNALKVSNTDGAFYDYFNLNRIFELAESLGFDKKSCRYFPIALEYGFINELGLIKPIKSWSDKDIEEKRYWIDFFEGTYLYHYMKDIFSLVVQKSNFIYINEIWSRSKIVALIKPGDFILVQGLFSFQPLTKKQIGMSQLKKGYRKAKGIKIEFEIDLFYCNSESSRSHLSGRNVKTLYAVVRSIKVEGKFLVITCTALASGTGFNRLDDPYLLYPNMRLHDDEEYDDVELNDEDEHEGQII